MTQNPSRREFHRQTLFAAGGLAAVASGFSPRSLLSSAYARDDKELFKISLAEWSFHKALFAKEMDHLDFPKVAKDLGIDGVEFVNQFFKDKAEDKAYLADLKQRVEDADVVALLIMIDGEGDLGAVDKSERAKTVDNHKKWVEASKTLGGHSIRVNARSYGTYEDQVKLAADGLRKLSEFAATMDMNVIVENHGGLSSNGKWLAETIKSVGLDNCGTLPDFGNFMIDHEKHEEYDKYKGVEELMPYAKAVSAKSHVFDKEGNESNIDYERMMKIVLAAGYHGFVGIEYEGSELSEKEGVIATKKLLEKVREKLS